MYYQLEGSAKTKEGFTVWIIVDDPDSAYGHRWAGLGRTFKAARTDAIQKASKHLQGLRDRCTVTGPG